LHSDRYKALAATGFPVIDSSHPDANLQHHLSERSGGHFVDVGDAVDLISGGQIRVRGRVGATAYTPTGLQLSDGSTVDTDAIIWCTGFADHDARTTAAEVLGGRGEGHTTKSASEAAETFGPWDVAARLDATWALDAEGEIRGMWKRHLRLDNYWVMGGNIQQQRWWSRILAQQIRLALDDALPPAYRDTPGAVAK
jgi:hypothetical protein